MVRRPLPPPWQSCQVNYKHERKFNISIREDAAKERKKTMKIGDDDDDDEAEAETGDIERERETIMVNKSNCIY